jgi:hypothetical protein
LLFDHNIVAIAPDHSVVIRRDRWRLGKGAANLP